MGKYDYDKDRKKRELLEIFADHKKEFINWLRKKSIEPEKILDAEYRKCYQIHKDFNQYYLEKQKTEYKKLLEESEGDLEKQNITLNKFLFLKNHFESLRINLCSLDTNELEQMGTNTAEKNIKAQLFHSIYSFLQDLITGSRMNYLKLPNELRPKIFQVEETLKEILINSEKKANHQEETGITILNNICDDGFLIYEKGEYKLPELTTMKDLCNYIKDPHNGVSHIKAGLLYQYVKPQCKIETIQKYLRKKKPNKPY